MPLPKLKDIKWVTTDCYGTLIDWEKGIVGRLHARRPSRDGFSFDEGPFIERFFEIQAEIMARLLRALRRGAAAHDRPGRRARSAGSSSRRAPSSCPTASPAGCRSARPTRPWTGSASATRSGSSPTSTTSCSGVSRRHLRTDLDLVVTAQQVRSYKPDPAHFKECARRIGGKKGWVHIGSGYETDVAPLLKMNVPVIWVNRHGEKLDGRKPPTATVKNFREAAKRLGAGG